MNAFMTVFYFLFNIAFNMLLFILWLRVGLHYFKFSSLHPISKLIHSLTDPLVQPINRMIIKTEHGRSVIEWAGILVIVLAELVKFLLIGLLFFGTVFSVSYMALFVVADFIIQPLNLLFYMVLIRVIMSWVQPNWQHPANDVMREFTEPLLRLGNYIIPNISGFDFSPIIVLLVIKSITLFISASLPISLM